MKAKKTPIENELDKYYFATQSIERYENELGHIIDHYSERYTRISLLLEAEYAIINRIKDLIARAELNNEEKEYVRMRHFEQIPMYQIECFIPCSTTTLARVRKKTLERLEKAFSKCL